MKIISFLQLTERRGDRRGFTLIELLIVVAIIAILAAIAVPNFLEAQTRSKVSRVQSDMRTVVTALESYAVDHNNYPPRQAAPTGSGQFAVGDALTRAEDMSRLTTPISYITSLPVDIFENRLAPPNNIIDYWESDIVRSVIRTRKNNQNLSNAHGWALLSVGPDGEFGRGPFNIGNLPPDSGLTYFHAYDPTNGTVSKGNIYRLRSQAEVTRVFNP